MTEKVKTSTSSMPGMQGRSNAGDRSKDMKKAYSRLWDYMKKYKKGIVIGSILAIAGSILNLIGPNKLSDVTNLITDGLKGGHIDIDSVVSICVLLAVLYGIGFVLNFGQAQIMAVISQLLTKDMRKDISDKMNRLPLRYFDSTSTGDTLSIVTNDVDTIGQMMNQSFSQIVSSVAMLIGSMVMMFYTNYIMAVCGIAAALIGFAIMIAVINHSEQFYIAQQNELGGLNGLIEETFSNFQVVKVNNGEKLSRKEFSSRSDRLYDVTWKSQFYSSLNMPLMIFIGNLAYVVVCIAGGVLAVKGSISMGTIVAFMLYIRLFTQPLQNISQTASSMQSMAAACERVFDFLEEKEMDDESGKTKVIENEDGGGLGDVDFEHLRFGYSSDKVIIHDFNEHFTSGNKIAIVGPTGAGKTTIVNLLMRFYDPDSGKIVIDGTDIADVKRENVREQFSMVLQDTWLFEGTLRENLVYNREGITDEKLDEVCEACGLTDLVKQLPNGYDTVLNDNANISQGQRQLITIARAMIKDAPLLILDEATSSVDTRTEQMVQKAMDKLTEGRTSFVIAHRLSTIKNADKILVLRDGDVVESGTHDELMAKGGFYADLYNSQFDNAEEAC
ncbi:MAG: ABC transporter ATP-binding protein [Anaerovoracaceae bacterium]